MDGRDLGDGGLFDGRLSGDRFSDARLSDARFSGDGLLSSGRRVQLGPVGQRRRERHPNVVLLGRLAPP